MELRPQDFFDLSSFRHAELFDGLEFVWEAIPLLQEYLARTIVPGNEGTLEKGARVIGDDVQIGAGTVIEAGATVRGPVLIGANCTIRSGAILRGGNLVGDGCTLGNSSELKNTILLNGANAPHFNYCGDSILGAGVNLGAGTKLSNLRFDNKNIVIQHAGRTIDSGLRKFGAILGDGAQTGCNAVLNPGTLLGPKAMVFPCAVVSGVIEPGRRAR